MGQVPQSKSQSTGLDNQIAIIGDGRWARHLAYYLDLKKIPFVTWSRKGNTKLEDVIQSVNTVCLCISDDAIDPFIDQNAIVLADKPVLHFSGALYTEKAVGVHPLMTFPKTKFFDIEDYESIHFIVDEKFTSWDQTIAGLSNPIHKISEKDKARYHALCVMAGNFSMLLWDKLFSDFERVLKIPRRAAFPYMAQTFTGILEDSKNNLTGPLVRKDQTTIDKNISALSDDSYQCVYQSFVKAFNGERTIS